MGRRRRRRRRRRKVFVFLCAKGALIFCMPLCRVPV
jgi:hypothetical protein